MVQFRPAENAPDAEPETHKPLFYRHFPSDAGGDAREPAGLPRATLGTASARGYGCLVSSVQDAMRVAGDCIM